MTKVKSRMLLYPAGSDKAESSSTIALSDKLTIGRHPSNEVMLPIESVSRFHASVICEGDDYILKDLRSSNGTFVNGKRIQRAALKPGDKVAFGDIEFFCRMEGVKQKPGESTTGRVEIMPEKKRPYLYETSIRPTTIDKIAREEVPDNLEALQQANRQLRTLYRLVEILTSQASVDVMLDRALSLVCEVVRADQGVVMTRDDLKGDLVNRAFFSKKGEKGDGQLRISRSIVDRCQNEQVAILVRDAASDSRFDASASIIRQNIHSAICAPLMAKSMVLGIVFIDSRDPLRSFDEDDLAFVSSIAQEMALSLELRAQRQELIRHSQMAAVGETVMNLAHGIKNILQVSDSSIKMVERALHKKEIEQIETYWPLIEKSLTRVNTLVLDMLNYSRKWKPNYENVELNELVKEMCDSVRNAFENRAIEVSVELDEQIRVVSADPEAFRQSLENLLVNAAEAIEGDGGRIQVRSRLSPTGDVQVAVTDNGVGIPKDNLESVFFPSFSTKGEHGTGLGLATVKKYFDAMGGDVRVDSEEGRGTTFTLMLPSSRITEAR